MTKNITEEQKSKFDSLILSKKVLNNKKSLGTIVNYTDELLEDSSFNDSASS